MAFTVGVVCDIGVGAALGGRDRNEDNYLLCRDGLVTYRVNDRDTRVFQPGDGVLIAVCDGMGGHTDGHVASTTAAKVLAKLYQPGLPRRPARVLLKYIQESHRQLHWAARTDGPVGMGTTLTAVWMVNGQAAWAHVGDSRLYQLRSGKLTQLTADHTRNEFARRDGRPPLPEGEHLAQNFIYGSRGLGDNAALRLEQGLDNGAEDLAAGDRYLLCSDGLTTVVDDGRIGRTLLEHDEPSAAANALRELAIDRGSRDNITAVVVRVDTVELDASDWNEESDDTLQF
ncbi:MAG: protein phosphatase 2C domain-containing protein [Myxococcota bacterium]